MGAFREASVAAVVCGLLVVGIAAQEAGPQAQAPPAQRTWRAGRADPRPATDPNLAANVCASLAQLDGLDLYVAVSRGRARAGDLLLHLACHERPEEGSRAALVGLASSGQPEDLQLVIGLAGSEDLARASGAVEALLLAGHPVDVATVLRAYEASDVPARRRLLVAMSAAGAADCLEAAAAHEPDERVARDARRRLDALR